MDGIHELFGWARTLEAAIAILLLLPLFAGLAGFIAARRARRAPRRPESHARRTLVEFFPFASDSRPRASGMTGSGRRS